MIISKGKLNRKPFEDYGGEQLELVSHLEQVDFQVLRNMENTLYLLYKQSPYLDEQRIAALCAAYKARIDELERWERRK